MSESKPTKYFSRVQPLTQDDQVVISGVSGRFPNADNMAEFTHKLYNKIDFIDDADIRWVHNNPEVPKRMGKISGLTKFDANFFGVHYKQAHCMDPQIRIVVEMAYQAVLDAGIHPQTLRGSKTGVFCGACFAESEKTWFYEKVTASGYGITGCSRAMLANRISFAMDLEGPSFLGDTGCSSSMNALDCAYTAIMNGECDAAIVGGTNVCLHPYVSVNFRRLGFLAPDGYCRPFDEDSSGYTRSEAICVVFLQKKKDAKRCYGSLLYSKSNFDGYKEEGINFPSERMQAQLFKDFYQEIDIDPRTVSFIEAHGTGTRFGDTAECNAVDEVFCTNRKEPLYIGSVKSNLGHGESTAGLCSLAKCIVAMDKGLIPPNINFNKCRSDIQSLSEGRLKVVSDVTPLPGDLIAVNSFGFGGSNVHCLLKANTKEKINHGAPQDTIPRLIVWSGRTEEAVNTVLDDFDKRPLDTEYTALIHSTQASSVPGLVWKGFGLYSHLENENAKCLAREVQHYSGLKRPIVFIFSGMGSQWIGMGSDLMCLPIFRNAIELCQRVLAPKGLDVIDIITSKDPNTFDNILHSFVGIAAIQIGLVDVLKVLNIVPDYIIGHSVGELGCGYADGAFSAEQMILSAYSRGMASIESNVIHGAMAAVAMGYKQIKNLVPQGIEIACHNSTDSCTLSGPSELIEEYVKELQAQNIFARTVPTSNIPYHSSYIAEMGPRLLARLNDVIPNPKSRSDKWLSSSVPKSQWDQNENQLCSAQYHTNNLLGSVLFEETSALLPANSLTVEIAPHGLMQAILRRSMPNGIHVGLTQRGSQDNMKYFLNALGKLYLNGIDMPLEHLYPLVEFPVSRGTPMISHLLKWDHSEDWNVIKYEAVKVQVSGEKLFRVSLQDQEFAEFASYVIDSKIVFPSSGLLYLVWQTFAGLLNRKLSEVDIEFQDVKFLRSAIVTNSEIDFVTMIQHGTGRFEINQGKTALVVGCIREVPNLKLTEFECKNDLSYPILSGTEFYLELEQRGYQYKESFKHVLEVRGDGSEAKVKWVNNWVTFLDNLFQINSFAQNTSKLLVPSFIEKLCISQKIHQTMLDNEDLKGSIFDVKSSKSIEMINCGGIEIKGLQLTHVSKSTDRINPSLLNLVPNVPKISRSDHSYVTTLQNGDLESLNWVSGPFNMARPTNELIRVCYAAVNIRDLLIAAGECDYNQKEVQLGFEYSGISETDHRLMGLTVSNALATYVRPDDVLSWDCPPHWSLAECSTVPMAYGLVYSALFFTTHIQHGKRILIHSGTEPIGLAALYVAFAYGLDIFTTVSTEEQKKYLLNMFPQLKKDQIGSSNDISFEYMVMKATNGRGVHYVLNSLSDEGLQASIRCVGKAGQFLEFGDYDMNNDCYIGMAHFLKEISFHVVRHDSILKAEKHVKKALLDLISADIRSGVVKPLKSTVFTANQLKEAFKNVSNTIGKTIIKIRETDDDLMSLPIAVTPRFYCDPNLSYVICGEINEVTWEIIDYLTSRNCMKLIIHSEKRLDTAYQLYKLKMLESKGVMVQIKISNLSSKVGCEKLIQDAIQMGHLGGLFVILSESTCVPIQLLDQSVRKMCPRLHEFVVISLASTSDTNRDQVIQIPTEIIQKRHNNRLPAKFIQWNQKSEMNSQLNCFQNMDILLQSEACIVTYSSTIQRKSTKENVLEQVMQILEWQDIKSVSDDSPLSNLGMDIFKANKIKKLLEETLKIIVTPLEIHTMTYERLQDLIRFYEVKTNIETGDSDAGLLHEKYVSDKKISLIKGFGDESIKEQLFRLQSNDICSSYNTAAVIVPGIEGVCDDSYYDISCQMKSPTFIVQMTQLGDLNSPNEIAKALFENVHEIFKNIDFYYLIGYSYGALITIELAKLLEDTGMQGQILLIDGAPKFIKDVLNLTPDNIQDTVLQMAAVHFFGEDNELLLKDLKTIKTWKMKVQKFIDLAQDEFFYSDDYVENILNLILNRLSIIPNLEINTSKSIKAPITLLRPNEMSLDNIEEDYGLSNITEGKCTVKFLEGNHNTVLENPKLPIVINEIDPANISDKEFNKFLMV